MNKEIEISEIEYKKIMGDIWDKHKILENNFYCSCGDDNRQLIEFKIYLSESNDIVLKGKCSNCNKNVARLIEISEHPDSEKVWSL